MNEPEIETIARRVAQILLAALPAPAVPRETLSLADLQLMLNCSTPSATCRAAARLGIRPYLRGKYRRKDAENAIARRSYAARSAVSPADKSQAGSSRQRSAAA